MLILGALFIEVVGMAEDGEMIVSKQLCYIARGLKTLYLSQNACKDLGLIAKNFPKIGSQGRAMVGEVRTEESRVTVGKLVGVGGELEEFETFGMENSPCKPDQSGKCQCPRRGETSTATTAWCRDRGKQRPAGGADQEPLQIQCF